MTIRPVAIVVTAVVLALLLTLVVVSRDAEAGHSFSHWDERSLTVADRTGDQGWQEATSRAVRTWNAVGADVRLSWVEGGIGCGAAGPVIPVCREALPRGTLGTTSLYYTTDGHLGRSRIRLAAGRALTQAQRDNIACQELGHALGLDHSGSTASCMSHKSISATPDAHDADALRTSYAHPGRGTPASTATTSTTRAPTGQPLLGAE